MTTPSLPPHLPPELPRTEKKRPNCWVVGCGGCLIFTLLILGITGFVGWKIWNAVKIEPFPPVELSAKEEKLAMEKLQTLNLVGGPTQTGEEIEIPVGGLRLSETEVNYWLSSSADIEVADSVRVDFEPGRIAVELRIGNPDGMRWKMKGAIGLSYVDEVLDIRLLDVEMGAWSLPAKVLENIGNENFAESAFADPEALKEFQSKVERIEVFKDEILILPKLNKGVQP